ncbi:MAG TPA: four helix bundle protein, partial [Polyangiaceae bacterium]|nr:four helix bundle protein [Polyangiaceae bacterium]
DKKTSPPENEPEMGTRGEAPGRQKIPPSLPPVVLQMEDLTLWIMLRVAKFPRDHRFTLGDRLIEACLSVLDDLVHAAFSRDKVALLTHASRTLTRARTLVRLANRAHLLAEKQRTYFAEQSDEIGKKISGWTRHARTR